MLLDAVDQVELFISVFVGVYTIVLIAYVLTSWIQLPDSMRPVGKFLHDVCEPYLRLWRRVLPQFGPLDLSPLVAIIALGILAKLVVAGLEQLH